MTEDAFKITLRAYFPDLGFRESFGMDGEVCTRSDILMMPVPDGFWSDTYFTYSSDGAGSATICLRNLELPLEKFSDYVKWMHSIGTLTCGAFLDELLEEHRDTAT